MSQPKFQIGDRVRVTTNEKTGTIKAVFDSFSWAMIGVDHEYTIEFDDGSGATTIVERVLELVEGGKPRRSLCVCGVATVGQGKHSDWCELYDPNA